MTLTNHTSATFEHRLNTLRDRLRDLLDHGAEHTTHLKERVVDAEHRAADRTRDAVSHAGTWIQAHPVATIAVAFGVGYAVSRAARR